ncbi:MAG: methyltransferase domain-containing protein [Nostoc sp.]
MNTFPTARIAKSIIDDYVQGIRLASGQINTYSGSTHIGFSEEESLHYIEEVFTDYKKYTGIEKFFGVVAEIGPGDNAGVALLMRRDGATQVDLLDRFYSYRNSQHQTKIYETLAKKYEISHFKTQDDWDEQALAGINWKTGQSAEDYFRQCAQEQGQIYDFIISRAVLEHLYNPLDALADMVTCLKKGGRMFHEIDLRDHNWFSPTQHELFFLQIPSFIYPFMVRNSGGPNRILLHRYRDVLESMKKIGLIDYSILVTNLVNVGRIEPHKIFEDIDVDKQHKAINFVEKHRQKFAREFCNVDTQYLSVGGIFVIVTRN